MLSMSETLEVINKRLSDRYGKIEGGHPNFRVVWSTGITEVRLTDYVAGIQLIHPEYREMLKYPFDQDRYILEKITPTGTNELVTKLSYEPVWVFKDKNDNPLPAEWLAIEYLLSILLENMGSRNTPYKKYVDAETPEMREANLKKIYEQLYGNETSIGDRLALKEGVGYTGSIQ